MNYPEGTGFNQKLENMVKHFMETEEKLEQQIKRLEKRKQEITEDVMSMSDISTKLKQIDSFVSQAKNLIFYH
jgi:flagellar hook-basal body complex protein FliE